jgi:hypothetical protein
MQSEEQPDEVSATPVLKGSGLFTDEGITRVTAVFAKAVADAIAENQLLNFQESSRYGELESPK